MNKDGDTDISPHGVRQMISTFAVHVSVSADSDDAQSVVSELEARCDRDTPSMKTIKDVASYVMRKFAGLSYSGDDSQLVRLDFKLYHGLSECLQDAEIAASGAPGRCASFVIIQ